MSVLADFFRDVAGELRTTAVKAVAAAIISVATAACAFVLWSLSRLFYFDAAATAALMLSSMLTGALIGVFLTWKHLRRSTTHNSASIRSDANTEGSNLIKLQRENQVLREELALKNSKEWNERFNASKNKKAAAGRFRKLTKTEVKAVITLYEAGKMKAGSVYARQSDSLWDKGVIVVIGDDRKRPEPDDDVRLKDLWTRSINEYPELFSEVSGISRKDGASCAEADGGEVEVAEGAA